MPNISSPRYRRVFIQQQSGGLRTINNSSGTWSNTGAKLLRIPENGITITPRLPKTPVPWLTGTRSRQPDILGRRSAEWSINNLMMIPSGTAGTAPDTDALWQNVFGQAATVSAGVSVTYSFLDSGYLPFALFDFMHNNPGTLTQRVIWGCMATELNFTLNGNIFDATVRGEAGYSLESDNFSNEDSVGKAGLTSFPAEPVSPTSLGNVIPGFGGTAVIGGNAMATQIQGMSIRVQTAFRLVGDLFSDAYPAQAVGGLRTVGLQLTFLDDDSSALATLKQNAKLNTPTDVTITVGTVSGLKCQFVMKQLQFVPQTFRDQSDEIQAEFPDSMAHASAVGNVDEFSMIWL